MPGVPVVSVRGLTKRFGTVLAVDDLSFSVEQGQVCGLLGPNGAGKSTVLRALVGLVHSSAGEARLFDEPVRPGSSALRRAGVTIEAATFVPYLSGLDNLRLWWEAGGAAWTDADVDTALRVAGLGEAIRRRVKTYSQGMRPRLGLARALLARPEVLILDEPTNGLDPQEMRTVRALMRTVSEEGVTVLLSSHLLAEVEQVCSHVVVMDRGHFVAAGTVTGLTGAVGSAYFEVDDVAAARTVLGAMSGVRVVTDEPPGLSVDLDGLRRADVVRALVAAGVGVETVTSRHRLEDAFLGLVGTETTRHVGSGA